MAVWNIRREIIDAAHKLGITVTELPGDQSKEIRELVVKKFIGNFQSSNHIWESLPSSNISSYQAPHSWKLISEFLGKSASLMFFDSSNSIEVFEFRSGEDLVSILEECFGFEFYLVDREITYLLCCNEYDVLIGTGIAKIWVEELTNENSSSL